MLKISLYHYMFVPLHIIIELCYHGKNQDHITVKRISSAIGGGISERGKPLFSYALPCRSAEVPRFDFQGSGATDRNDTRIRKLLGKALRGGRDFRLEDPSGPWAQTHHGLFGRRSRPCRHRERQAKHEECERGLAAGLRQGSEREHLQEFFIRIGARYRRIRKRPNGKPSPQLYANKAEKLQELERQWKDGLIDLYYGDESHICTEGCVPYGWQFRGEDVAVPSQKGTRLNLFGMIDRNNHYNGFTTTESITADKVADFLDRFSFRIKRNTFIVLDNAKIHRSRMMAELRPVGEKRGLFLFFLPPYSPHLNIAETLWRILKGKWLRPTHYMANDTLMYATNRVLATIGYELCINFTHVA